MDADEIRELREDEELTVAQAAVRLGVSPDTWYRWERGENEPLNAHHALLERWWRRVASRKAKETSDDRGSD